MQRRSRPPGLNDITNHFARPMTKHYGATFYRTEPRHHRVWRAALRCLCLVLALLALVLVSFRNTAAELLVDAVVATEVDQAVADVRQQLKVERAMRVAGMAQ